MSSPRDSRVLATVISAWIALATSAHAQNQTATDIALLPPSNIPYKELQALEVNVGNTFRGVVQASEDSGIAQISALLTSTNYEEQWAYVPAIGSWIEVGTNEVASDDESEVEADVEYIEKLVGLFGRVHLYHSHPAGYYSDGAWQQQLFPADFPAYRLASSDLRPIGLALPSTTDVAASIELSLALLTIDPEAISVHSVVSRHGVVTYGPTELGMRRISFERGSPCASIANSLISMTAIRRAVFNIARTIDLLGQPTISEVIEDLCGQGSDENYEITFTPHSNSRHPILP